MVAGTSPILTHVGALDSSGALTDSAHAAFVAQTIALLTSGNADGKGLFLAKALGTSIPPFGGPTMNAPSLTDLSHKEHVLWFDPDPTASLSIPYLRNRDGIWSKLFVDGFYAGILKALNLNGSYVPPVFDPTIYGLDFAFDPRVDLPKLAVKIPEIITPELPNLLKKLGVPSLEIPPVPAIPPTISLPAIPEPPPIPGLDPRFNVTLVIPEFFKRIAIGIPGLIIPKIPTVLLELIPVIPLIELFLQVLIDLNLALVSPRLLVATMLVMLQNVAVAIACDVLGLIVGTGSIVKSVAVLGGLASS
jgi:hypothetical protein